MAAELHPPENAAAAPNSPSAVAAAAAASTAAAPPYAENIGPPLAPKRQRRPSVRLGDIGEPLATLRTKNPWSQNRLQRDPNPYSKPSKTRHLTNLVNGHDWHEEPPPSADEGRHFSNDANVELGHRRVKSRRGLATKRARSHWVSKPDDAVEGDNSREENNHHHHHQHHHNNNEFRDFDLDSDSQLKDQSPVHSADNPAIDFWHHRPGRTRVSESRENDANELDNLPESDSRDRKCGTTEGVRSWLIELGLSRYAPVFEIHEVDDEVLPLLTLEDLKDMGINAVGSRRKLYTAIQKLRKGFS